MAPRGWKSLATAPSGMPCCSIRECRAWTGSQCSAGSKNGMPEGRIIMITAYASIELAVEAMKLGATDFVRKPMTPEILRNTVAAALEKSSVVVRQPLPATAPLPERPRIEALTMNGFHIVRLSTLEPGERRFLVKNPAGLEQEVGVDIDAEAVDRVERLTRRRLPFESSFWTMCAERSLATYLWNEGRLPSIRLAVTEVNWYYLDIAARWEEST